jgi:uncharacterized protein with PIN domain
VAAYFFDTTALAKLYHQEAGSDPVEELVRNPDHRILISPLAVVEMYSVFALKVRSQAINTDEATALRRRFLSDIRAGVFEVLALAQAHYERAEQLIASYGFRHRLRTLDALQLSVAGGLPPGLLDHVVASDRALGDVAILEQFSVIDPEEHS